MYNIKIVLPLMKDKFKSTANHQEQSTSQLGKCGSEGSSCA